ncbi:carbon-nitrogen hydrolase family protein [Kordiimonas pumila]|uniref:Carbon-nitrogen hydrolase family protein n=1 Tax=Kordiimonas pumila TaxID=2161677 RepID=A0ABV7D4N7_9PROT|nr:carbon-nitrogen hydrolase family protein [Kordiimonas pumila]
MKVCLIQMNSRDSLVENLQQAENAVRSAVADTHARLVVLPELFTYLGGTKEGKREAGQVFPESGAYRLLQSLAKEYGVYLHGGSMIERDGDRLYNTTVVFDPKGSEIAKYRKIHLFDVVAPDGAVFRESDVFGRGENIVTYKVDDHIVGCSICYDLRFPELYAELSKAGADIIIAPAAFTLMTGKDHWEILCRSRAMETQTYVLATNQVGTYSENGEPRASYGHSMVVDPWGTVLARAQARTGHIVASLDFDYLNKVRADIPVQRHHVLGQ